MKDVYEDAKKAARDRMMREATLQKQAFIRELKQGLGEQLVQELEAVKPPTKRQTWWNKIKKVLGL